MADIENEIYSAITAEKNIQDRKSNRNYIRVETISFICRVYDGYLYKLELESPLHLASDQRITLTLSGIGEIEGQIVDVTDYTVLVVLRNKIDTNQNPAIKFTFNPTFILEKLNHLLIKEKWLESVFAQVILLKQLDLYTGPHLTFTPDIYKEFNDRQKEAIKHSLLDAIHIIWGPPGTGKTKTLGRIIFRQLLNKNPTRTCLLLSVSNAAVDQLVASLLQEELLSDQLKKEIVRLGVPTERFLDEYTPSGRVYSQHPDWLKKSQQLDEKIEKLKKSIAKRELKQQTTHNPGSEAWNKIEYEIQAQNREIERTKKELAEIAFNVKQETRKLIQNCRCIATTLARLAVNTDLQQRHFDVVFIDEISMVPLVYILMAARMAEKQMVFAGDPKQLPPIYLAKENENVKKWFGRNLYDHLNIETPDAHPQVTFLNEQYRMQEVISDLVSQLSYEGKLQCRVEKSGNAQVLAIPLIPEAGLQNSYYYSVSEKSYYFPLSLLSIVKLVSSDAVFQATSTLLLSPFRAQAKLFSKLAHDLQNKNLVSSAIHRAQGSERENVILDLTIYDPQTPHPFFKDVHAAQKLINVALSRAKNKLVVFYNPEMLQNLGKSHKFFKDLYRLLSPHSTIRSEDLLKEFKITSNWIKFTNSNEPISLFATSPSDTKNDLHTLVTMMRKCSAGTV